MKVLILIATFISFTFTVHAQSKKGRIIYKYKEYEKFDFEDMVIDGEIGSPGDLSITPRYQRKFKKHTQ